MMGESEAAQGRDRGPSDTEGGCTVCGDVGVPGTVLALDPGTVTATVEIEGEIRAVAVDLLDGLKVGDLILIHAGVAIARVEASKVQMGGGQ